MTQESIEQVVKDLVAASSKNVTLEKVEGGWEISIGVIVSDKEFYCCFSVPTNSDERSVREGILCWLREDEVSTQHMISSVNDGSAEELRERLRLNVIPSGDDKKHPFGELSRPYLDVRVEVVLDYDNAIAHVGEKLLQVLKMSADEVFDLATENTKRCNPVSAIRMTDIMRKSGVGVDDCDGLLEMYVLKDEQCTFGATSLYTFSGLVELSVEARCNLFLLPSSRWELIAVPDTGDLDIEALKRTVYEVNRTQVAPRDFLSDSVYYYDAEKNSVLSLGGFSA